MIKTKKLLLVNILILVICITLSICCIVFRKTVSSYIGALSGVVFVTVFSLLRCIKMIKNPDYKKQVEIDINDERTKKINAETASITGFIIIMICSVCGIITIFLNKFDYLYIFGSVVLLYSIIYLVVKALINKKY
ncbi:MAG: hypothetical protein GX297_05710 [Treponema sp.]|nr:hypothetical protein [Treponema sp.]